MSLDSAFLNLVRGNRLSTYMGLTMAEGVSYRFSRDYSYVEIPLGEVMDLDAEKLLRKNASLKKGGSVKLIPACAIDPKNYKVLVAVNPKLMELLSGVPLLYLLEPDVRSSPGVIGTLRKDCGMPDLAGEWFVRLYLLA